MKVLGKDEIMALGVLALIISGVCAIWLGSKPLVAFSFVVFVGGIFWAMIAVGVYRFFGAYSVVALAKGGLFLGLYLAITAIVLAIYILVSINDFGVNWLDHVSWFFRVVGVIVSLAMFTFLWFVLRERRKVYSELPSEHPPSDLPAAAVSELVDREENYRTPTTIVLEMLQRGALEVALEEPGPTHHLSTYRLTAGRGRRYKWEQTVCDTLPQKPTTRLALLKRLNEPELGLRQHIREHLRQLGLLNQESSIRAQNTRTATLAVLGVVLMGIGLSIWVVRLNELLTMGLVMLGMAYAAAMWNAYAHWQNAKLNDFTTEGRLETRRWRGFAAHLESSAFDEERVADFEATDSLMPYSAALNRIHLWRQEPTEPQEYKEPPSGLAAAIDEGWRESKTVSMAGFISGFLVGSYIFPGEGMVERAVGLFDFSSILGFGGSGGVGGDFGDGDGEDIDGDFGS